VFVNKHVVLNARVVLTAMYHMNHTNNIRILFLFCFEIIYITYFASKSTSHAVFM